MKKNKRLWMRTFILATLLGAVVYTLYANFIARDVNQKVKASDEAPDFILSKLDEETETIKLSDLRGKAVLLNFWGSWCGPCKREMPAIEEAYNQYKNQNFEVITINIEESDFTVTNFLETNNLSLPVVMDKTGEVYDAYGVYTLPASFFLNPDGTVNRVYEGEMTKENIDDWVNEILSENADGN
ncbi:thiol-disulfide oxidoreductase ResA [Cytobacillus firmus]|nr:thiol-disulfide oxidoreductase ResA [Cytobacillus firmus]